MSQLQAYVYEWPTRAEALATNQEPNTNSDWPKIHGPYATADQAKAIAKQLNEAKEVV